MKPTTVEISTPTVDDPSGPAAPSGAADHELIARAQGGDEEAFAGLYNHYSRRVYSLCLRMTGDPHDAEDLTQEVFLLVFRKLASFRGEAAFSTWLHRIALNAVLMRVRRKRLVSVSLEEPEPHNQEPAARQYGADDPRLAGTVDRLSLNWAIQKLPPGYRAVLLLHDVEGYEHQEIARILNCTPGNCKSQLHKARLKLRRLLRVKRSLPMSRPAFSPSL
jgi:RNA polymerase sigma-70 factor, ECF subfamily